MGNHFLNLDVLGHGHSLVGHHAAVGLPYNTIGSKHDSRQPTIGSDLMNKFNQPEVTTNAMPSVGMSGLANAACGQAQRPKSERICVAILEIEELVARLEAIKRRMDGSTDKAHIDEVDVAGISLTTLLDNAPGMIRERVSAAHTQISEIEDRLFN